jgi:predicted adenylyl cyclase CyaB
MAIEVEIKARVADPRTIEKRIQRLAGGSPPAPVDKDDWYLGNDRLFRLRREGGRVVFTTKERSTHEGIETNTEHEFEAAADQFDSALAFFTSLGFPVVARKTKRGVAYRLECYEGLAPLTIELCEVSDLGWFVELEFVLSDEALIESAKRALREALAALAIDDTQIESRPYLQLLSQRIG